MEEGRDHLLCRLPIEGAVERCREEDKYRDIGSIARFPEETLNVDNSVYRLQLQR